MSSSKCMAVMRIFVLTTIFLGGPTLQGEEPIIPPATRFTLGERLYVLVNGGGADYALNHRIFRSGKDLLWWAGGRVYSQRPGNKIQAFSLPYAAMAYSPSQQLFLLHRPPGSLILCDQHQRRLLTGMPGEGRCWRFVQNRYLVPLHQSGPGFFFWDTSTGKWQQRVWGSAGQHWRIQGLVVGEQLVLAAQALGRDHHCTDYLFHCRLPDGQMIHQRTWDTSAPVPLHYNAQTHTIYAATARQVWALDSRTLEVRCQACVERAFWMGEYPAGLFVLTDLQGLWLLDPTTLAVRQHLRVGRRINAYSLGLLPSPDGRWGLITTPYQHKLSIVALSTGKLVIQVSIPPACAAVLIPTDRHKGTCLYFPTALPYE